MRILIVEDDAALREQLATRLREEKFAVDQAGTGDEGLYFAKEYPIDLAIVDLGLPELSGFELIQQARASGRTFPILILTARTRWQEKVQGLEAGADDYLVKPFQVEELLARMRALLRRSGGWAKRLLECGPISLDASSQTVMLHEERIDVTAYEYKVLEYLMMHAGEVASKTVLTEHIYEEDQDRDSNVIEVFVRRLRQKLDPQNTLNPIETLRGRGYRFTLPRNATEAEK